MITIKNLHKHYGNIHALKGIDVTVKDGAFFALLGPNGAGKSTTIEILATLKHPDEGSITIDNHTLGKDDDQIRQNLGVVFQYSTLDTLLTVRENLTLRGGMYIKDKAVLTTRIAELADFLKFDGYLDQTVKTLSGGQKRRVDVARALLHQPRILLLDEPTTGLDPQSRENLWDLILKLKQKSNMTIILTTHYMDEVLDADHVLIIDHGEIKAEDAAYKLRQDYANDTLKFQPKNMETMKEKLKNTTHHIVQNTIHIPLKNSFEGLSYIEKYKEDIKHFEIVQGNMDDVFLNITGRRLDT